MVSAAQRLNQEDRPCHLVWYLLTGDIAQLLPIVRSGCALDMPEHLDYAPDRLPHRPASVNREGRLCVQIGVLGSVREPFTSYPMIGLAAILGWPTRGRSRGAGRPGQPAPFRQLTRPRSRALWARGGHYGASQVPECENIGPGSIDIDHLTKLDTTMIGELPELARQRVGHPPEPAGTAFLSVAAIISPANGRLCSASGKYLDVSSADLSGTPRTKLQRHRERGRTDRDDLYAVLDAGLICHLGVIADGVPASTLNRLRPGR